MAAYNMTFSIRKHSRLAALLAAVFFMLLQTVSIPAKENEGVVIEYYYFNACASCDPAEEIYSLLNEQLADIKQEHPYTVHEYNTFHQSDRDRLESRLEGTGISAGKAVFPLIIADEQVLQGTEEIKARIRECVLGNAESLEESAETEKLSESEAVGGGSEENDAAESIAAELELDDSAIILFTTFSCSDCEKVRNYLEDMPKRLELKNGGFTEVKVYELSIIEEDNAALIQQFFRQYNVPEKKQQVPAVFFENGYLSGASEIIDGLVSEIEQGKGLGFEPGREAAAEPADIKSYGGMFAAGLINGLNPCAASMFLMFLALLTASGRHIFRHGTAYLAGKFTAYLVMGLAVYRIFDYIDTGFLESVNSIIRTVIAVIFAVLAFMYALDGFHASRKEYDKIRMQLPAGLRRMNAGIIEKMSGTGSRYLWLAASGLGFVISAGEFFCTGQVYLAAILSLMKMEQTQNIRTLAAFVVYVTGMCIPLMVLLAAVSRTKNVIRESNRAVKYMPWIKLITAGIFLVLAVFMMTG